MQSIPVPSKHSYHIITNPQEASGVKIKANTQTANQFSKSTSTIPKQERRKSYALALRQLAARHVYVS